MTTALVIHGHFYQPPRENPWTGIVDREPSAAPFHDWNERIHRECYRANAFARILDGYGRVDRILNNYERISFDFGPTLLSWIERHDPVTYARILEADRKSARAHGGHGNAIAHGYNHAILPLCNERDRRTQIRWGLHDFRHRFGRAAEALWLPETACDAATLAALIDHGLRFVILSPHQAERVRPIGDDAWTSVEHGQIDPSVPYACMHPDGSGRSIAVFFYDGAVARAVAFDGTLGSSQAFVDRLDRARPGEGRLLHTATDGESYGHHTRYGERTLAYALEVEAPARGLSYTNYGAFLDQHPPQMEVALKPGPNGEGTAWSCAHGVGRWYRDCGCQDGGRSGFSQAWRTPLRQALDLLRDEAARAFAETADDLFVDPWAARDAYIELLLDPDRPREAWLRDHAPRDLTDRDRVCALTHLWAQHAAQLMYTSCGWFFTDISGIEAVQVLKYAGRVLDLMEELGLSCPRDRFLEVLAGAKSNHPAMGTGADVFVRFVEPLRVSGARVSAHLGITSLVDGGPVTGELAGYRFTRTELKKQRHGRITMATGRLQMEARATGQRIDLAVVAMHLGGVDFHCALRSYPGPQRFHASVTRLWSTFRTATLPALLRIVREELGPDEHGLESVLPEERHRIAGLVFDELVDRFADAYVYLYRSNERALAVLRAAGFEVPRELALAAQLTLERRFEQELERAAGSRKANDYRRAIEVVDEAERHGCNIGRAHPERRFERMIEEAVGQLIAGRGDGSSVLALVEIARRLRIEPGLERAQEIFSAVREQRALTDAEAAIATLLGFCPEAQGGGISARV